jgi:aryl-alcohol dehydrogenase-like predicted oxidoreductase
LAGAQIKKMAGDSFPSCLNMRKSTDKMGERMESRKLGDTGESISRIGLGTWQLAGMMGAVDRSQSSALIRRAIDSGITFIDCAEMYGDSEQLLGRALADGYRDRCFLATKVSRDFSAGGVRRAVENSLKALQTDRIDLYQIHRYDPSTPVEETLEAMAELQKRGLIRHCGVSNFNSGQLQRAKQSLPVVSDQINYNALNRSAEKQLLDYCRRENVAVIVHSSLAKGLLCGKYTPDHTFAPDDERSGFPGYSGELFARYLGVVEELEKAARDCGLDIVKAAIVWLLAREEVTSVLVGPKSIAQLEESAGADLILTERRMREVRESMNAVLEARSLPALCPFPDQLV